MIRNVSHERADIIFSVLDDPLDPAAAFPTLDKYTSALRAEWETQARSSESLIDSRSLRQLGSRSMSLTRSDGLYCRVASDLTDGEMDRFLEFCQTALLRPESNPSISNGRILSSMKCGELIKPDFDSFTRMFPLGERARSDLAQVITPSGMQSVYSIEPQCDSSQGERGFTSTATPERILPGQRHHIFHSSDILGSLAPQFAIVLDTAAKWIGLGREDVAAMVETFERRLYKWANVIEREKERNGSSVTLPRRPGRKRNKSQ